MKIPNVLVLAICLPAALAAQNARVSGRVLNGLTEEPIEAATVFVQSIQQAINTDVSGFYELSLPRGVHTFELFAVGMKGTSTTLDFYRDTIIDFTMRPTALPDSEQ